MTYWALDLLQGLLFSETKHKRFLFGSTDECSHSRKASWWARAGITGKERSARSATSPGTHLLPLRLPRRPQPAGPTGDAEVPDPHCCTFPRKRWLRPKMVGPSTAHQKRYEENGRATTYNCISTGNNQLTALHSRPAGPVATPSRHPIWTAPRADHAPPATALESSAEEDAGRRAAEGGRRCRLLRRVQAPHALLGPGAGCRPRLAHACFWL